MGIALQNVLLIFLYDEILPVISACALSFLMECMFQDKDFSLPIDQVF